MTWRALGCLILSGLVLWSPVAAAHWAEDLASLISGAGKGASKSLQRADSLRAVLEGGETALGGARILYRDGPTIHLRSGDRVLDIDIETVNTRGWGTLQPIFAAASPIVLLQEHLPFFKPVIKQLLADGVSVHVFRSDNTLGRVVANRAGPGTAIAVEYFPRVFVDIGSGRGGDFEWTINRTMSADRTRVISLFHDDDVYVNRDLDTRLGKRHLSTRRLSEQEILASVAEERRKYLFVVGHIEGSRFVTRDAAGNLVKSVAIADLENIAARSQSELMLLGCTSGRVSASTGYLDDVNAAAVSRGLQAAIQQRSMGMALSALARASGDMYYVPRKLAVATDTRIFIERVAIKGSALLKDGAGASVVASVRLKLLNRKIAEEMDERLVFFIPVGVQKLYLVSFMMSLFYFIALVPFLNYRDAFVDISDRNRGFAAVVWVFRALAFLAIATPLATAVIFAVIIGAFLPLVASIACLPTAIMVAVIARRSVPVRFTFYSDITDVWLTTFQIACWHLPVFAAFLVIKNYLSYDYDWLNVFYLGLLILYYWAVVKFLQWRERREGNWFADYFSRCFLFPLKVVDYCVVGLLGLFFHRYQYKNYQYKDKKRAV
ncbi:hypothetical protein FKG94_16450 [Exilibacterium tricleocarpae]|uniref:CHAT domain-containing protein n=1 Tax=Exilibacterium tricleocarpae TaxID=2591008 RepID=A0A545TAG6_9GAMM|nr:hypothetical protein [Exilibacterium tricleocarpae]TQV74197.1 hypothetical protein FKG94_16450 [Exilibacterium tricleocarpae]